MEVDVLPTPSVVDEESNRFGGQLEKQWRNSRFWVSSRHMPAACWLLNSMGAPCCATRGGHRVTPLHSVPGVPKVIGTSLKDGKSLSCTFMTQLRAHGCSP